MERGRTAAEAIDALGATNRTGKKKKNTRKRAKKKKTPAVYFPGIIAEPGEKEDEIEMVRKKYMVVELAPRYWINTQFQQDLEDLLKG